MRNQAADWFRRAPDAQKRLIFKTTGSNPRLRGQKLSVEAAKPFSSGPGSQDDLPSLRGCRDEVRTDCLSDLLPIVGEGKFIEETRAAINDEDRQHRARTSCSESLKRHSNAHLHSRPYQVPEVP